MKKIRYILISPLISIQLLASAQEKTDSLPNTNSVLVSQSAKEIRNEKDSVAKSLSPIAEKAIVYIIRDRVGDFLYPYRLDCDDFQMGWVKTGTYAYTVLNPGDHLLICTPGTLEKEARLTANFEAGKIYYVDITYGVGIIQTIVKLKMMDESKGKKSLTACKISKSNQYPLFPKSKEVENLPPDEK
jgi:hypothetical protein